MVYLFGFRWSWEGTEIQILGSEGCFNFAKLTNIYIIIIYAYGGGGFFFFFKQNLIKYLNV